jgi:hypothetical protein
VEDGTLTLQIPPDIEPGEHKVILVIEEQPVKREKRPPLDFPVMSVGSWPENLSLQRKDMYDEWGR